MARKDTAGRESGTKIGADDRIDPSVHHHASMEARVLGGPEGPPLPETVWDREPLLTLKDERRLFQIALPLAIVAGLALGIALLRFGLTTALIGMMVVQTGAFFAIYIIAQRRRTDPLRQRQSNRGARSTD